MAGPALQLVRCRASPGEADAEDTLIKRRQWADAEQEQKAVLGGLASGTPVLSS